MSTLKQVASDAGVSYLTALRAMGFSPGRVRESTARRVREAARRLDYRPNAAARALTSKSSPYIGVLYGIGPGCSRRIPAAELMRTYAEFHFELTARLEDREFHVLTGGAVPHLAPSSDEDRGIPKLLQQRHVGALVVVGDVWPSLHREIMHFKLPTVGIYCQSVSHVATVDINYQAAARLCTQHLLALGHERIAFIPGVCKTWKTEPMQLGYLTALGEAEIKPVPCWDDARESAAVVADLLAGQSPPTAFVLYDDYEAVKVIDWLDEKNQRVPQQASLTAVQILGPGTARNPIVSGCRIPAVPMARRAVELLVNESDNRHGARDELIEAVFVAGTSSGRI